MYDTTPDEDFTNSPSGKTRCKLGGVEEAVRGTKTHLHILIVFYAISILDLGFIFRREYQAKPLTPKSDFSSRP